MMISTGCWLLPARQFGDARVVPIDVEHREQIGVIGLARVGRRRAAALQSPTAFGFIFGFLGNEPAPQLGVAQPRLLLVERQGADLAATRQVVERQI